MHSHNRPLTGSLTLVPSIDTTYTSSSVGLDWIPALREDTMRVYVSSKLDDDAMVLLMAIPYNQTGDGSLGKTGIGRMYCNCILFMYYHFPI